MCQKREQTGDCSHHQCQFSDVTEHGYGCVDVASDADRQYCEAGCNCLPVCPLSFAIHQLDQAKEAFSIKYPNGTEEYAPDYNTKEEA